MAPESNVIPGLRPRGEGDVPPGVSGRSCSPPIPPSEDRAVCEEETTIPHDAPEISEAVLERMQAETDTHAALMLNRDLPYHETVGMTPDELLAWGRAKQRAAQDDSDDPPF